MKKIAFAMIIAVIGTVGCNSSDGEKSAVNDNHEHGATIQMNKKMFIDEIMDYEKNKEAWVYKSDMPGIIDFYADWCRPCKITSPILDELAKEYSGKIKIYKVNVDKEKELAAVFGVQSIPTFLFMPKVGNPQVSTGIAQTAEQTKAMFKQQIEELLLK